MNCVCMCHQIKNPRVTCTFCNCRQRNHVENALVSAQEAFANERQLFGDIISRISKEKAKLVDGYQELLEDFNQALAINNNLQEENKRLKAALEGHPIPKVQWEQLVEENKKLKAENIQHALSFNNLRYSLNEMLRYIGDLNRENEEFKAQLQQKETSGHVSCEETSKVYEILRKRTLENTSIDLPIRISEYATVRSFLDKVKSLLSCTKKKT